MSERHCFQGPSQPALSVCFPMLLRCWPSSTLPVMLDFIADLLSFQISISVLSLGLAWGEIPVNTHKATSLSPFKCLLKTLLYRDTYKKPDTGSAVAVLRPLSI